MNGFNVLLLNAPWKTETGYGVRSNSRWAHTRKDKVLPFPVYLAYAAAVLEKNNFDVKVIDAVASELSLNQVNQAVKENEFDLIAIETTTPSIEHDLKAAEFIKSNNDIKVVLMGPHATVFDTELLEKNNFIDFVIRGEFEYTLLGLCNALKDETPLAKVDGLTYKIKSRIIKNNSRTLAHSMDDFPFPARHLFDMPKYETHLYKEPSFLMISSRGCPHQCTFCLWPQTMYGHFFRARSAKNVVDEMELLVKKHNAREICFDDDTFTIGKKRVLEICDEIKRRKLNVEWSCFGRVGLDEETLRAMKSAGCEHIRYGVESGSQEVLDRCRKNVKIQQIKDTFKLTKKVGIRDYGTFMIGLPGETWESVNKTIKLAIELDPYAVQFSMAIPFPGTEYYEEAKSNGFLLAEKWSDFDGSSRAAVRTEDLTKEDLEKAFAHAWKKFYLRPGYVFKSFFRHLSSFHDMKRLYKGTRSFFVRWAYYRNMLKAKK